MIGWLPDVLVISTGSAPRASCNQHQIRLRWIVDVSAYHPISVRDIRSRHRELCNESDKSCDKTTRDVDRRDDSAELCNWRIRWLIDDLRRSPTISNRNINNRITFAREQQARCAQKDNKTLLPNPSHLNRQTRLTHHIKSSENSCRSTELRGQNRQSPFFGQVMLWLVACGCYQIENWFFCLNISWCPVMTWLWRGNPPASLVQARISGTEIPISGDVCQVIMIRLWRKCISLFGKCCKSNRSRDAVSVARIASIQKRIGITHSSFINHNFSLDI
jgi:hypothetical protein